MTQKIGNTDSYFYDRIIRNNKNHAISLDCVKKEDKIEKKNDKRQFKLRFGMWCPGRAYF